MPTITVKLTDEEFAALDNLIKQQSQHYLSRSDLIRHALNNLFTQHKLKKEARDAIEASRKYNKHPPRRRTHRWTAQDF